MTLFSTKEAAAYLGMSVAGVKWHLYQTKLLRGQLFGKSLVFTQQELDQFARIKPKHRGMTYDPDARHS